MKPSDDAKLYHIRLSRCFTSVIDILKRQYRNLSEESGESKEVDIASIVCSLVVVECSIASLNFTKLSKAKH